MLSMILLLNLLNSNLIKIYLYSSNENNNKPLNGITPSTFS